MTIGIIDTSVFCNLLDLPGRNQRRDRAFADFEDFVRQRFSLLLPLATIFETGNHISRLSDGRLRRGSADEFVRQVQAAFRRETPWIPTPLDREEELVKWLAEFPDAAMRELSLGDLSILKVFERQCELHPNRRVFIWTYDSHLEGRDRRPGTRQVSGTVQARRGVRRATRRLDP